MKLKVAFLTTIDSKKNPQIGDCIVITFDDEFTEGTRKACIVIDGGYASNKAELKNYLNQNQVKIIDLMVATHIDNDHISGLKSFLINEVKIKSDNKDKFELKNYWGPAPKTFTEPISITEFLSYMPDANRLGAKELDFITQSVNENEELYNTITDILDEDHIFHPSVQIRDSIPKIFKSLVIDILAPDKQIPDVNIKGQRSNEMFLVNNLTSDLEIDLTENELKEKVNTAALENNRTANNQSIVIKLIPLDTKGKKIEKYAFLFTGDAEKESWDYMLEQWGKKLESKILKISHHGSRTGTNQAILESVKMKYCIICAGTNRHGLPDEDVLKMLGEKNLTIFCTGRNPNEEKKGPCIEDNILEKCPRWNNTNKKHIKDIIIFEVDTVKGTINYPKNSACGFDWKNL